MSEALDGLAHSLAGVVALLQRAGGAEGGRLIPVIHPALDAFRAAAAGLTARSAASASPGSETLAVWLHELRAPITAMAGWAQILTTLPDDTRRIPARETIERNVRRLMELLAHPPA